MATASHPTPLPRQGDARSIGSDAISGISSTSSFFDALKGGSEVIKTDHSIGLLYRTPSNAASASGSAYWDAVKILFVVDVVLVAFALVCAALLWFIDSNRIVRVGRVGITLANLLMFIGLLMWPFGLENESTPCTGNIDTKQYYICAPWEIGDGAIVMIVAAAVNAIALMVSTRVRTRKARKEALDRHNLYERQREAYWYGEDDDVDEDGAAKTDGSPRRSSRKLSSSSVDGVAAGGRRSSVRETSFWDEAFEDVDPEGYLDVQVDAETPAAARVPSPVHDSPSADAPEDDPIYSDEAARMLM